MSSLFSEVWLQLMKEHQADLLPVNKISNQYKSWFEYVVNTEKPKESTFRCRLCNKYYDQFHMACNYRNSLCNKEGVLYRTIDENRRKLREHCANRGIKDIYKLKVIHKVLLLCIVFYNFNF